MPVGRGKLSIGKVNGDLHQIADAHVRRLELSREI